MVLDSNSINNRFTDPGRLVDSIIHGSWNIYRTEDKIKKSICNFDTFLSLSFESNSEITSYPIQTGSFRNYNRINNPSDIKVSPALSGNRSRLKNTLDTLEYYKYLYRSPRYRNTLQSIHRL